MHCRLSLPNAAVILAVSLLGACSGSEQTKSGPAPAPQPVVEAPPPPTPAPSAPQADLSQHSVYFDFDKSAIRPDGVPVISDWAGYLTSHPTDRLRIEGNCDERGTPEYNVALGERRANAAAQSLKSQGVSAAQIEVISYGKTRPVALGHDEDSWAKNRRADLVKK